MVPWRCNSWSLPNITVPPRPCCGLWRTGTSHLSMAKSLPFNWDHHIPQRMLWPKLSSQVIALELRGNIFFINGAAENPNLLLFVRVFCVRQEMPERKWCKITLYTILMHTKKDNSFAIEAKKYLLIIAWEHCQPPAGRAPARECGISQGQPGIASSQGSPAPLSTAPETRGRKRPRQSWGTWHCSAQVN